MKSAYLASLIAVSATALAAPPPPPVAPQIAPPLPPQYLEVSHELEPNTSAVHDATWSIIVQADGTWQRSDTDANGARYGRAGSMNKLQQDALTAAIAKAKWKTIKTASACTSRFVTFDRYVVGGKNVWQTDTCDGLDSDSASAVSAIDKVLREVTAPRAWIEVDHRAESKGADVPSWQTILYTDGHWERHDDAFRGTAAKTSTGRVTPDELTTIRAAVGRSKWTRTATPETCDALGAFVDVYKVDGKTVWEQYVCGAETLDATSQKAVGFIAGALPK